MILLIILNAGSIAAQRAVFTDSLFMLPDSVAPFTIENFYTLILQNHPVARQTELLTEVARQEIRMARGNFDPQLEAEFVTKNYNNQEYYSILNGSLKFPTTLPLNPTVGIEQNKGDYLNP